MSKTKYGHMLDSDEQPAEDASADGPPPVYVADHELRILDEREDIPRYNGFAWTVVLEDGLVVEIQHSRYAPGPTWTEPMGCVPWPKVPAPVQEAVLEALGDRDAADVVDDDATREAARGGP